ncbi:MAG TPA: FHA domain-containing protein, partial [Humisphaera sp.]|nr:FHA domain-containing protein [Humisphaera sp.]
MPEKVATRKSANVVPVLTPLGSHTGKPSLPLGRPFTLIGSRHRAHLHLLSRTVSKSHAAIIASGTGLYIRDLASRERVYVNDKKVREANLTTGDIVRIGSFVFKYNDPAARQRPKSGPQALAASLTIEGNDLPTPIDQRTLVIGRRPTCDLPLVELSASTIHAIIFEVDGQRYIRDLGSRTGTLVNGAPVHQRRLINNDTIKIGDTTMRYVVDALAKLVEEEPLAASRNESLEQPDGVAPTPAIARAPESAPIPLAGEDDLISIAPDEPPTPAPTSKADLTANEDTGQHLLVASDLHEERLSGSGSFADVHAHVEDEDGLVEHQPVNLDWWPENNASPATPPAAEQQPPSRAAAPQPKADDELIPLAMDEDHVELPAAPQGDAPTPAAREGLIPIEESLEHETPEHETPERVIPKDEAPQAEVPESVIAIDRAPQAGTQRHETPESILPIDAPKQIDADDSLIPIAAESDADLPMASELPPAREPVAAAEAPITPEVSRLAPEIISAAEEQPVQADFDSSEVFHVNAVAASEMSSQVAPAAEDIELLPETEPTPESAQAMEPDVLAASEAAPQNDSSLMVEDPAPTDLSDSTFGRAVEDLAGPPLGPLVEQAASHAPADELVSGREAPQSVEPAIEVPALEEDLDVVAKAPTVASDRDAIEPEPLLANAPAEVAAPMATTPQLSEDAAADLLTSDPELPPIPNLAELLGEDEPTGDDVVDNANAFLAHAAEESSEPVDEAPTVEGASSAPKPASTAPAPPSSAPQPASSAPVEESDASTHAFTVPSDLLAEASGPTEELSDATPLDTSITYGVPIPLDVPRSEEIAPREDRIDVEEYEPAESAREVDIAPIDVAPASAEALEAADESDAAPIDVATPRTEAPEAEPQAPEGARPSHAPRAAALISPLELELRPVEREIPHISARPTADAPDEQIVSTAEPELDLPEELDELRPAERALPHVEARPIDEVQDEQIVPEPEADLADDLDERPSEREVPHISARPEIDDRDEAVAVEDRDEPVAVEPEHEAFEEVYEPLAAAPQVLDEAPAADPRPPIAPAVPVAELRDEPRAPMPAAPEPTVSAPAGNASLNDLLSIMSRDAGSFMGGMPLAIAPVSAPGVVPVTLKLKEDPPVVAAPPTPAPIAKVEPNLPANKVVGVPPKEEVDDESSFFEDKLDALDDLPDDLEPIGDITEAVGEAPASPPPKPAPAPPRQAAPAPAAPVRPQAPKVKLPPPPPPRPSRRGAPQPI